ncbi:hypothetical protein [Nostoc sp.]
MSEQEENKPETDVNKSSTPQINGPLVSTVKNQKIKDIDEKMKRLKQK